MEKQYLSELLKGNRVHLKKHEISLAEKMYQYVAQDKERLARFLPWPVFITSVDDEYMGNITAFSLNFSNCACEIGYWILGKFEGKGYMSDAVTLLEQELYGM